jgi:hypothetical protein
MGRLSNGDERPAQLGRGPLVRRVRVPASQERLQYVELPGFSLVGEFLAEAADDPFQELDRPGAVEDFFGRLIMRRLEAELRSVDELHDQVRHRAGVFDGVDGDDVVMGDGGGGPGFAHKALRGVSQSWRGRP